MFFLAFALPVSAYSHGNSNFTINYQIANPVILGDGSILQYTPDCFQNCYLPINISYGGVGASAVISLKLSNLSWVESMFIGDNNLQSVDWSYLSNDTVQNPQWISNVQCGYYGNNTCLDNGYLQNSTSWSYSLKPMPVSIQLTKNNYYVIVIHATRRISTSVSDIDIVPSVFSYSMPQLAWFNSTFPRCKNITMTDNAVKENNYTFLFNITNFTSMNPDASDVRFVNDSCNGASNAVELTHWTERQVNSSFAEIYVLLQNTTKPLSIYYGNPTATDDGDITSVGLFGDTFNRGNGAVGNGWVDYNSCSSIFSNTMHIVGNGALWFCGAERYITPPSLNEGMEQIFLWNDNPISDNAFRWDAGGKASQFGGAGPMYSVCFHHSGGDGFQYYDTSNFRFMVSASVSTNYLVRVEMNSTVSNNATVYINGTMYSIAGGRLPFANGSAFNNASFGRYDSGTGIIDNFLARKYNYNESSITYTFSSEMLNGTNPTAPLWSSNWTSLPANYSPTQASVFNVTWLNGSSSSAVNYSVVNFSSNFTGSNTVYNMSCSGTNCSYSFILPAGTFYWNSSARSNDTTPLVNTTPAWIFSIPQLTPVCTLSLTPSTPSTYGNPLTAVCSCNSTDTGTSVKLFRNGTDVTSQNNSAVTLGVSTYSYICNSSSTTNFTAGTTSQNYVINQATPSITVTFNTSSTVIQGAVVNITCNYPAELGGGASTMGMWNNSGYYFNPNSQAWSILTTSTLTVGTYNYLCNSTGDANYTTGSGNSNLYVTASGGLLLTATDEKTSSPLTFNVTLSNSSFSQTYYNQVTYNNNTLAGVLTAQIWSGSINNVTSYYPMRRRYFVVPPNSSLNVSSYLLDYNDGHSVTFYVVSLYNADIQGALVTAEKLIGSNWVVVDSGQTDTSGSTTLFLDPTANTRVNFSVSGYASDSLYLTPSQSAYMETLSASGVGANFTSIYRDLMFNILPYGKSITNSSTSFTFWIQSYNGTIQWFSTRILYYNGTVLQSLINSSNATGGNITVTLNLASLNLSLVKSNESSIVYVEDTFQENGYSPVVFNTSYYVSSTLTPANNSIMGIANNIQNGKFPIDPFSFGVISLIVTVLAMGLMSRQFSFVGSGFIGIGIEIVFTFLGTYIYGLNYYLGWEMLLGTAIAVLGMSYIKGGG